MTEFRFANPAYLFLLLALPLAQLLALRFHRNARERLLRFVAAANLDVLLQKSQGASRRRGLFFWLGLACLILALARPQANPVQEEMEGASLDIYVLLDVSRSMDAEDVAPSRLAKAKRTIQSLTQLLAGDRIGVIAFAGTAVMISPLTADYDVIRTFLQNVDTNLIQNQGTDITNALSVAEEAMKRGAERTGADGPRSNVFLVLSDGEDHAEMDWGVVDSIRKEGGVIFTIAFGGEAEVSIPVRNDRGELMGHKRDRLGNDVKTAVQTKTLEEIAQKGGGQFYYSTAGEEEVRDILNRLQSFDRSGAAILRAKVYQEFFMPVLGLGIALLLFSFFSFFGLLQGLGWRKAALFFLFLPAAANADPRSILWDSEKRAFNTSQSLAQEGKVDEAVNRLKSLLAENPDSPELNYDIGTYLLGAKKYDEARAQLGRVANRENPLRELALFNIAGSYGEEGKKDEARAAYAETIRSLQTKNRSAADNQLLELAKQNLARLASENSSQQQQQQKQDQNKDQQQNPSGGQSDQKSEPQKPGQEKNKENEKSGQDKQDNKDNKQGEQDKKQDPSENPGEKKDEKQDGQQDGQEQGQNPPPPRGLRTGKKSFKQKGDMSENDAKQILEALKQREMGLQKKFMKQQKQGEKSSHDSGKDW